MTKRTKINASRKLFLSGLLVSILTGYVDFSYAIDASALPTGGNVVSGAASIATNGARMTVTQASKNAILNWNTFDIGSGASVSFAQPDSSSVALNRVLSANPSQIMGSLSANGIVYLVNPQGIVVGQGAQVNVGSLVASTLNISDADFLAGHYNFVSNGAKGTIVNQGTLTAAERGFIALLGDKVINEGIVSARLGSVALASGSELSLSLDSSGLISVGVGRGTLEALVQNTGALVADGGRVLLTAKSANDVLAQVVNNTGILQAQTIGERNGQIWVLAADSLANTGAMGVAANAEQVKNAAGAVHVGGTLDVSSQGAGAAGEVTIAGTNILVDGAINASGKGAGAAGRVLINAVDRTVLAAQGVITASSQSDAGSVVLWSGQKTEMHGLIDGRGQGAAGHGANVEISSEGRLQIDGALQLGAQNASLTGSLLLDPATLDIGTDVTKSVLEANGGNIVLTASGQITFDQGLNLDLNASSLTIVSQNTGGVRFLGSGNTLGSITTHGGDVAITASGAGVLDNVGQITTNGGNVNLSGVAVNFGAGVDAGLGNVNVGVFGGGITGASAVGAIKGAAVTLDATYGYIGNATNTVNVDTAHLAVNTGGSVYLADASALQTLTFNANHFFGNNLSYSLAAPNFTMTAADTQGDNDRYDSSVHWMSYNIATPSGTSAPATVSLTQDWNLMPESVSLPGTAVTITSVLGDILGGNVDPLVAGSLVLRSSHAIGGLNYSGNVNSHSLLGVNGSDDGMALLTQVSGTIDARVLTPVGNVADGSIVSLSQIGDLKGVASASFIDLIATGSIGTSDTPFVMNFDGRAYVGDSCSGTYYSNGDASLSPWGDQRYVSNHINAGTGNVNVRANFNADNAGLDLYQVYAGGNINATVNALNSSNNSDVYVDGMLAQNGNLNLTVNDSLYTRVRFAGATGSINIQNLGDTNGLEVNAAILYGEDSASRGITLTTERGDLYVWKISTNGDIWNDFGSYAPNGISLAPASAVATGIVSLTAQSGSIYSGTGGYAQSCGGFTYPCSSNGGYMVAGQLNLNAYSDIWIGGAGLDTNMTINAIHSAGGDIGDIYIRGYGIDSATDAFGSSPHSVHFGSVVNENGRDGGYGSDNGVSLGNSNGDVLIGSILSTACSGCGSAYVSASGGIYADGLSYGIAAPRGGRIDASGPGGYITLDAGGSLGQRAVGQTAAAPLSLNAERLSLTTGGDLVATNDQYNVAETYLYINNTTNANIYSLVSGAYDSEGHAQTPSIDFHATSGLDSNSNGLLTITGTKLIGGDGGADSFYVYSDKGIFVNGTVAAPVISSANYLYLSSDNSRDISIGTMNAPASDAGLVLTGGHLRVEASGAVNIGRMTADHAYIDVQAYGGDVTVDSITSNLTPGGAALQTDVTLRAYRGVTVNNIAVNQEWDGSGVRIYAENGSVAVNQIKADNSYVYISASDEIAVTSIGSFTAGAGAASTNVYLDAGRAIAAHSIKTLNGSIQLDAHDAGIAYETLSAANSSLTLNTWGGNITAEDNSNLMSGRNVYLNNYYGDMGVALNRLNVAATESLDVSNQPTTFNTHGGGSIYLVTKNDPSQLNLFLTSPDSNSSSQTSVLSITPSSQDNANGFSLSGTAYYSGGKHNVVINDMGMVGNATAPAITINPDAENVRISSGAGVSTLNDVGYVLNFGHNVTSTDLQLSGSIGKAVTMNWNNNLTAVRTVTGWLDIDTVNLNVDHMSTDNSVNWTLDLKQPLAGLAMQFNTGSSVTASADDSFTFHKSSSANWGGDDQTIVAGFHLAGTYGTDKVSLSNLSSTLPIVFGIDVLPNTPLELGTVNLTSGQIDPTNLRLNAEKITSTQAQTITADSVTLLASRDVNSSIGDATHPVNIDAPEVTLSSVSGIYVNLNPSLLTSLNLTVAHPITVTSTGSWPNITSTAIVAANTYQIQDGSGNNIVTLTDTASTLSSNLSVSGGNGGAAPSLNKFALTTDFSINVGTVTVGGSNSEVALKTRATSSILPDYSTDYDFARFKYLRDVSYSYGTNWVLTNFAGGSNSVPYNSVGIFDNNSAITANTVTLDAGGYLGSVGKANAAVHVTTPNLVIKSHGDINVADSVHLADLKMTITRDNNVNGYINNGRSYAVTDSGDFSMVLVDNTSNGSYSNIGLQQLSSSNLQNFSLTSTNDNVDIALGAANTFVNLPNGTINLTSGRDITQVTHYGRMDDNPLTSAPQWVAVAAHNLNLVANNNIYYGFNYTNWMDEGLRIKADNLTVDAGSLTRGGVVSLVNLGSVNLINARAASGPYENGTFGGSFFLRAVADNDVANITMPATGATITSPSVTLAAYYGTLGNGSDALTTNTPSLSLWGGSDMHVNNQQVLTDLSITSYHNKPGMQGGAKDITGLNTLTVTDTGNNNQAPLVLGVTDQLQTPLNGSTFTPDYYQYQMDGLYQPHLNFGFTSDSGMNLGNLVAKNISLHSLYGDILQMATPPSQLPALLTADSISLWVEQDHSIGTQAHPVNMVTSDVSVITGGDFFGTDTLNITDLSFSVYKVQQIDRGDGLRNPLYSFDNSAAAHPVIFDLSSDTSGNGTLKVNRLELPDLASIDHPDASANISISTMNYTPSDIGVGRIYAPGLNGDVSFSTANNIRQIDAPQGVDAGVKAVNIDFYTYGHSSSIGSALAPILFDTPVLRIYQEQKTADNSTGVYLTQMNNPEHTLVYTNVLLDYVFANTSIAINANNFSLTAGDNGSGAFSLLSSNQSSEINPVALDFTTYSRFNVGRLNMGYGNLNLVSGYDEGSSNTGIYADDPGVGNVNISSNTNVNLTVRGAGDIGSSSRRLKTDIVNSTYVQDETEYKVGVLTVRNDFGDVYLHQASSTHSLLLDQGQHEYSHGLLDVKSDAGINAVANFVGGGGITLEAVGDINTYTLSAWQNPINVTSHNGAVLIDGDVLGASAVAISAHGDINVNNIGNYWHDTLNTGLGYGVVTNDISVTSNAGNVNLHGSALSLSSVDIEAAGNINFSSENPIFGITPSITLHAGGTISTGGESAILLNNFKGSNHYWGSRPDVVTLDIVAGAGSVDVESYAAVQVAHMSAPQGVSLSVYGDYYSPNAGITIGVDPTVNHSGTIAANAGSVNLYTQSGSILGDAGNRVVAQDTITILADQPLYANWRGVNSSSTLSNVYSIGSSTTALKLQAANIDLTANGDIYAVLPTTGVQSISVARQYVEGDYSNLLGYDLTSSVTRDAYAARFNAALSLMPAGTVSLKDTLNNNIVSIADGGVTGQSVVAVNYGTPLSFGYQSINNISISSINLAGSNNGAPGALNLGVTNPFDLSIAMSQVGGVITGGDFTFNMTPQNDYGSPVFLSGLYNFVQPTGSFGTALNPINTQVTGLSGQIVGSHSTFYVNQNGDLTISDLSAGGGVGITTSGNLTVVGEVGSNYGPVTLNAGSNNIVLNAANRDVYIHASTALNVSASDVSVINGALDPDSHLPTTYVQMSAGQANITANTVALPYASIQTSAAGGMTIAADTSLDLSHSYINASAGTMTLSVADGSMDLSSATINAGNNAVITAGTLGSSTLTGTINLNDTSVSGGNQVTIQVGGNGLNLSGVNSIYGSNDLAITADQGIVLGRIEGGTTLTVTSNNSDIQGTNVTNYGIRGGTMTLHAHTSIGDSTPVLVDSYAGTLNANADHGDVHIVAGTLDSSYNSLTLNATLLAGSLDVQNYYGTLTLGNLSVTGNPTVGNFGNVSVANMYFGGEIDFNTINAYTPGSQVKLTAPSGNIIDGYGANSTGITASRIVLNAMGDSGYIGSYNSDSDGSGARVNAQAVLAVSGGDITLNSKTTDTTFMPLVASSANGDIAIYTKGGFMVSQIMTQQGGSVYVNAHGNIVDDGSDITSITTTTTDLNATGYIGTELRPITMTTDYLHASADGGDANLVTTGGVTLINSNYAYGAFNLLAQGTINIGDSDYYWDNWYTEGSVRAGTAINLTSTAGAIYDNNGWSYGWDNGYDTLVAPSITLSAYGDIGGHSNSQTAVYLGTGSIVATSQTGSIDLYNNYNADNNYYSTNVTLNAPQGSVSLESYNADLVLVGTSAAHGETGDFKLYANNGSIYAASSDAKITANFVDLYADGEIGSMNDVAPIQLSTNVLRAYANGGWNNGDVFLVNDKSVIVSGENYAAGTYSLTTTNGNITLGEGSNFDGYIYAGNAIELTSQQGSIVDRNGNWSGSDWGYDTLVAPTVSLTAKYDIGSSDFAPIYVGAGRIIASSELGSITLYNNYNTNNNYSEAGITLNAPNGSVYLESYGADLYVVGANSAHSTEGRFDVQAYNGSIYSGSSDAKITANAVNLYAEADIGNPYNDAPIQLSTNYLTAYAEGWNADGNVALVNDKSVTLVGSNHANYVFGLSANGSILGADGASISAYAVELYAQGDIGSSNAPIQLSTTYLTAQATGDGETTNGDVYLANSRSVTLVGDNSATGTFSLTADGDINLGEYNGNYGGNIYAQTAINLTAAGSINDNYGWNAESSTLVSPSVTLTAQNGDVGNWDNGPIYTTTENLVVNASGHAFISNNYYGNWAGYYPSSVAVTLNVGGDAEVDTYGDMVLTGTSTVGGWAGLYAYNGSITGATDSWITATDLELYADHNIGTVDNPVWFTASTLSTTANGNDGTNGDVYLGTRGDITLTGTLSARGTYGLTVLDGSIYNDGGVIEADGVYLKADFGIGDYYNPIQMSTNKLTAIALGGDAYLSNDRTVTLVGNSSASGLFSLSAYNGSILGSDGAKITANEVDLYADGDIGTSNAPIQLSTNYLSANANGNDANGDVYLSNDKSVTLIGDNYAYGTFSLTANGDINLGEYNGNYGGNIYAQTAINLTAAGSINDNYGWNAEWSTLVSPSITLTAQNGDVGNWDNGPIYTTTESLVVNASGNAFISNNYYDNWAGYYPSSVLVTINAGANAEVDSYGDIMLNGTNSAVGTYSLYALGGGSIYNDPTVITAATVVLQADGNIGTADSRIELVTGELTAKAFGGDVYLSNSGGNLTLVGDNGAAGTYSLIATGGSILAQESASITASAVNLQADGSIGTQSLPVNLITTSLTAVALDGDAYLKNSGGDIYIQGENSATGVFSLQELDGSIFQGEAGRITANVLNLVSDYSVGTSDSPLLTTVGRVIVTSGTTDDQGAVVNSGQVYIRNTAAVDTDTVVIEKIYATDTVSFGSDKNIVLGDFDSVVPQIKTPATVALFSDSGNITSAFASSLANPNIMAGATPAKEVLTANSAGAVDISIGGVHAYVGEVSQPIWVADYDSLTPKDNYNYTSNVGGNYINYKTGLNKTGGNVWINYIPVANDAYPSMPVVTGVNEYTVRSVVSDRQTAPSITIALPIVPAGNVVPVAAPMAVTVNDLGMSLPTGVAPVAVLQDTSYGTQSDPLVGGNSTEVARPTSDQEKRKNRQFE